LPASKAQVEKQAAQASEQDRDLEMEYRFRSHEQEERITPGKAIGQNGFVRAAQELLSREAASAMEE
jgi:hypothetical protein